MSMSDEHPTKEMSCQVCGASDYKVFLPPTLARLSEISADFFSPYNSKPGHFQIVECSLCKHLYCTPIRDFTNLNYQEAPTDLLIDKIRWKEISADRDLKLIERHIQKGRLLEIGSGLGAFLSVAKERGWQARRVVIEISGGQVNKIYGADFGGKVKSSSFYNQ